MVVKTPLIIEQHFHGAYGIDFNNADVDGILFLADKLLAHGIGGFYPTLVTDSVKNLKRQIDIIKKASIFCERILGIHLEGNFLNPLKKGIHNQDYFMDLTIENYKLLEDDFIKIVTLAPELDKNLINYLKNKNIKVQAGHCIGYDLDMVSGITHTFNAMTTIHHREQSTALSAIMNDNLYAEIIADGVHVSNEMLRLMFKVKPVDKIILISDSLPITYSNIKETIFADSKIYYNGEVATSSSGTIAGSTTLLDGIINRLWTLDLFVPQYIENVYKYHEIPQCGEIYWDKVGNIQKIFYKGQEIL